MAVAITWLLVISAAAILFAAFEMANEWLDNRKESHDS
jgi:hypothetical protein